MHERIAVGNSPIEIAFSIGIISKIRLIWRIFIRIYQRKRRSAPQTKILIVKVDKYSG